MAKKVFESWTEAYVYQLSSREDENDPLFLLEYFIDSGVEPIDTLIATSGKDVVWLVVVDEGKEQYTQYGVGRNQKWYSVQFKGFGEPLVEVEGSFKEFSYLPDLVSYDNRAKVVYHYIEEILETFNFLTTGRILASNEVDYRFVENAKRMIDFSKSELIRLGGYEEPVRHIAELEDLEEFESIEEEDLLGECNLGECCGEECDCCEPYTNEEVEEYFESAHEEEDEELPAPCCEGCCDCDCEKEGDMFELNEEEKQAVEQLVDDIVTMLFDVFSEAESNDNYNQEEQEDEKDYEQEEQQEELHHYRFTFGDSEEEESTIQELTETEANDIFNNLVEMGFEFVEVAQIKRVHLHL